MSVNARLCFSLLLLTLTPFSTYAQSCTFGAPFVGPAITESLNARSIYASKPDFSNPVSTPLAHALEKRFEETLQRTQASEASISLYSPEHGFWSNSRGNTAQSKPFWLASIGKLATAIVITQLIEEKQLLPDDTIDRWFPEIPQSDLITIDQLLRHTSGLHNFNHIDSVRNQREYKSPAYLLEKSVDQGLDFCPGTDWNYSNTGYLVLARIAEKLDEKTYANIVQDRIASPLNLSSFKVISQDSDSNTIVTPVTTSAPEFRNDIAGIHGAGSIVSTTNDAITFLSAYLRGQLISDSNIADSLQRLYPVFSSNAHYGRGVMVIHVPDPDHPTVWVGHSGGAPDGKALLMFDLTRKTYLALALNVQAPAEAIANAVLKELD